VHSRPAGWAERVNAMVANEGLERLRLGVQRSGDSRDDAWARRRVRRLGLEPTLRDPWEDAKGMSLNSRSSENEGYPLLVPPALPVRHR
jgi:hypothetical protein